MTTTRIFKSYTIIIVFAIEYRILNSTKAIKGNHAQKMKGNHTGKNSGLYRLIKQKIRLKILTRGKSSIPMMITATDNPSPALGIDKEY